MARHQGHPRGVNDPDPARGPVYPGAPHHGDARAQLHRDAERCHILPPKRGVRVMTQGVFDILHLGHLHYFQAARALGDELVVIIARDETVSRNKHAPVFGEDARREMVEALAPVDYAVLGHKGDFYRVVEELAPDIICIGYDQPYKEDAIEAECARRGLTVKVVRLEHMDYDLDSTRKVVKAIAERLAKRDLYPSADNAEQARLEAAGVHVDNDNDDERAGIAADKVNKPRTAMKEVPE